jgi:hypothetical protein
MVAGWIGRDRSRVGTGSVERIEGERVMEGPALCGFEDDEADVWSFGPRIRTTLFRFHATRFIT